MPVWVVRAGGEIFIRSWKGPDGIWFRHASTDGTARISGGGVERDVTVTVTGTTARAAIDQAYGAKYGPLRVRLRRTDDRRHRRADDDAAHPKRSERNTRHDTRR